MLKQRKKVPPVKRITLSSALKIGMDAVISAAGDIAAMNFEDAGKHATDGQSAVLGPAAWGDR